MSDTFFINGQFVPEEKAQVSVLDRAVLFGDAVYEVTAILDGKLIDNDAHMKRLERSLGEIAMEMPLSPDEIVKIQTELAERNKVQEGTVYLQVSRGAGARSFALSAETDQTLFMFTKSHKLVDTPQATNGIAVVTLPDIRWQRRDIKTTQLLGASLAKQHAIDAGVDDAWFFDEDEMINEGTSSNAFIIKDNKTIQTRTIGTEILGGITRKVILELAEKNDMKVVEKAFSVEEAKQATEAFITGSSTLVQPVVEIDGEAIGDGKPGDITKNLRELYLERALES